MKEGNSSKKLRAKKNAGAGSDASAPGDRGGRSRVMPRGAASGFRVPGNARASTGGPRPGEEEVSFPSPSLPPPVPSAPAPGLEHPPPNSADHAHLPKYRERRGEGPGNERKCEALESLVMPS